MYRVPSDGPCRTVLPALPALQHPDALASTGQHWTDFPAAPRGPDFALFGNLKIVWYLFCNLKNRMICFLITDSASQCRPALASTGQRWEFFKCSGGVGREFFENTRFPDAVHKLASLVHWPLKIFTAQQNGDLSESQQPWSSWVAKCVTSYPESCKKKLFYAAACKKIQFTYMNLFRVQSYIWRMTNLRFWFSSEVPMTHDWTIDRNGTVYTILGCVTVNYMSDPLHYALFFSKSPCPKSFCYLYVDIWLKRCSMCMKVNFKIQELKQEGT